MQPDRSASARCRRTRTSSVALKAFVLSLAHAASLSGQADAVKQDARIELFSILYYLAGAPEYTTRKVPGYAAQLDMHFAPFRDHPAVQRTRVIRSKYGTGFFHPMNLAVHLTAPPELAERTPFDLPGHALGSRWPADSTRPYLELVRAFYREAEVERFLRVNGPLRDSAAARLKSVLSRHGDPAWFRRYFGTPAVAFTVVPSLINGGAQYGPTYRGVDGTEEAYAVIGVYKVDGAGSARFDSTDAYNTVHEFAHTLTNRQVTAHLVALDSAARALYTKSADQFRQQGYGNHQTMLYEAVVRAVVVRFIALHDGDVAARKEIQEQTALGFVLTEPLVNLLREYEQQRNSYHDFASFMPRIVDLIRTIPR